MPSMYGILADLEPLKYLFIAEYRDGSLFQQNIQDISSTIPTSSAFSDVRQQELKRFSLRHVQKYVWDKGPNEEFFEDSEKCIRWGENSFVVDLTDGHFEVNGISFRMHESGSRLENFRLIFFRRHTETLNAQLQSLQHETVYRLGWQANDSDGQNVQYVMEID